MTDILRFITFTIIGGEETYFDENLNKIHEIKYKEGGGLKVHLTQPFVFCSLNISSTPNFVLLQA